MRQAKGAVALVTQDPFPCDVDVRTRKFAETLRRAGHRVVIMSHGPRRSEANGRSDDLVVYASSTGVHNGPGAPLDRPFPLSLWWTNWILALCRRERPSVLVVNGLRLFLPAYLAARRFRIPVISDLSEHFPAMGQMQETHGLHKLIKNRLSVGMLESLAVRLADEVWVVVEDQRERLDRLYGVAQKTNIVSNTPPLKTPGGPGVNVREGRDAHHLTIGYFGLLEKGRGLQHAIRALRHLPDRAKVQLVIAGDGQYKSTLMALTTALGLERQVDFRGWIPSDKMDDVISEFEIGIIPHTVCEFTQHTVPNKLFDFMRLGVPVLATPMRPVARVVEAERCGVVIPEDPRGIAKAIEALWMKRRELSEMGVRGQGAVRDRYNWGRESHVILRSIDRWINGQQP